METVTLGSLNSFHMAMDDANYNMGLKNKSLLSSAPLNMSAYPVTYKYLLKSFICTSAT